jgi:hypothetical protein
VQNITLSEELNGLARREMDEECGKLSKISLAFLKNVPSVASSNVERY